MEILKKISEYIVFNKVELLFIIVTYYVVIDAYYQSTKDESKNFKDNLINAFKHLFRNAKQKFLEE
jgi:hypothetical protein